MSNSQLTADIVAKAAVAILDNNLVFADKVFRGYEEDFSVNPNGYTPGSTITIRKPVDYTVRDGATAAAQDVVEGSTTLTVNKRKGIDFKFTSQELTLNIKELSERVIKPAMVQLANQIDADVAALAKDIPSWVGTAGQTINSYADFAKAPERLDEYAVGSDGRIATLAPADYWGLLGSQTALYMQDVAKGAYRNGSLGMIGDVSTHMSQNVPTLTMGSRTGSILIDLSITSSTVTYDSVKATNLQTIHIDALGGATQTIKAGEVFTIDGVYAVNPVTKAPLAFLKQFVVTEDAVGVGSECDLIISPAMIWSGPYKNVDVQGVTDLNNQPVTFFGTASTSYRQNLVFQKNAFALVTVPLVSPPGANQVGRQSYKGTSVRVIPVYDGINDESMWRLDVLYGVKTIDARRATRLSGSS
jgi:hypothetical protein